MKDKLTSLLDLICRNRDEIADIYASGREFYFRFRGRAFSVLNNERGFAFYVYPRWTGEIAELAGGLEHGVENPDYFYLFLNANEIQPTANAGALKDLWDWVQSKYVGLDDLLRDVGLN